jgi:hypothetical protein
VAFGSDIWLTGRADACYLHAACECSPAYCGACTLLTSKFETYNA